MKEIQATAYIRASAHFLQEEFPAYWDQMSPEEIDRFVEDHKTEMCQNTPTDEVVECIEILADDFIKFALEDYGV